MLLTEHHSKWRLAMVPSIMANKHWYNYQDNTPYPQTVAAMHKDTSYNSPFKPGTKTRLLRPNVFSWDHRVIVNEGAFGPWAQYLRYGIGTQVQGNDPNDGYFSGPTMTRLTNEALARFTGKVRKHNASLGVTLASWKQSVDMIKGASEGCSDVFHRRFEQVATMKPARRKRILISGSASAFLGAEFGWVPLIQDIQNALGALSRNPAWPLWVQATVKTSDITSSKIIEDPQTKQVWYRTFYPEYRVCVGGRCIVTSENVWLANRLGLLNLPGVAWDLVPWSFVFNMFNNMSQMVNSLTDFCGVTIDMSSTTKSVRTRVLHKRIYEGTYPGYWGYAKAHIDYVRKARTLGLPSPKFMWKVPDLNLELVAIAAALPLQRLRKLNQLVGYNP